MVHKKLEKADGTKEEEWRYYISSIGGNVDEFERASRGHWGVEVNLHWHLDFTFRDDKNTSTGKTSAKNLQIIKKIALAILSLVKESYKIRHFFIFFNQHQAVLVGITVYKFI